ncbi:conserved hypothetical protein [Paraburkholderia caribensis]|uniref:DUF3293 domain-containing protein n=1 Tax=Paraburkholderia caribensis TaxID=75105 RepID=UPI001CABDB50|nr:DUF3293 domain-containing protein [Paraburkholderia caribensis]CAG9239484.1 conserved hypothetical protein [Paraburkholderia caribensis]
MTTSCSIDPATIQAYRETHFRVQGDTLITLLVDQYNPSLAALHETAGVQSSAFVTAWNPYSKRCGDDDNVKRQEALSHELRQLGLKFVDGIGQHPTDRWGEPSFLVLGISLEAAKALGERYEQNAIVWCGVDAVPELVLLR